MEDQDINKNREEQNEINSKEKATVAEELKGNKDKERTLLVEERNGNVGEDETTVVEQLNGNEEKGKIFLEEQNGKDGKGNEAIVEHLNENEEKEILLLVEEQNGNAGEDETTVVEQLNGNEEKEKILLEGQNDKDGKDNETVVEHLNENEEKEILILVEKQNGNVGKDEVTVEQLKLNEEKRKILLEVQNDGTDGKGNAAVVEHYENEEKETLFLVEEENANDSKDVASFAEELNENKAKEKLVPAKQDGRNDKDEASHLEERDENIASEEGSACEMQSESDSDSGEEYIVLPSSIRDKMQIYMPPDKTSSDPGLFGKWMWFSDGDICLLDEMWLRLQSLLENEVILLIESSTARRSRQGVIKCYTSENKEDIIRAGLAMRSIINNDVLLFYKTNQASNDSLNRRFGDRFITTYMVTVSGIIYERDDIDRWKRLTYDSDIEDRRPFIYTAPNKYLPPHKRRLNLANEILPSRETEKGRYKITRAGYSSVFEPAGMWYLFCSITDWDDNGMTELDRIWIVLKELFHEGIFVGISAETAAYVHYGSDANESRRSLTCWIKDYEDVRNVIESGDKLLERTQYAYPIYMKSIRPTDYKNKYNLRYLYTENRELYGYIEERWNLIRPLHNLQRMEYVEEQ